MLLKHNTVSDQRYQAVTDNYLRTDSGEVIEEDASKKDAIIRARELAMERNATVNVVVSKRLVGMDGVIAIAEFIPLECADDT
jgi:hypothetical protein